MKKKIPVLVIIILMMCFGSFAVFKLAKIENKKENRKENEKEILTISEDIVIDLLYNMNKEEYKIDDFIFRDANILINEGKDCFEVTLVSKNAVDKLHIEIILYDKDDKKIETLDFNLTDLTENDERYLVCFVEDSLIDVYSFEVKIS